MSVGSVVSGVPLYHIKEEYEQPTNGQDLPQDPHPPLKAENNSPPIDSPEPGGLVSFTADEPKLDNSIGIVESTKRVRDMVTDK